MSINTTTTPAAWNVRGENVRIPEGDRRNPIVFLDLWVGRDWGLTVALQHLRKTGFILRLPTAPDGSAGIRPAPDLMGAMQEAAIRAVQAQPAALEHLLKNFPPGRRKVGGKRPKADAA